MFKDLNVSDLKRDLTQMSTKTFLKRSRFYLNGAHDSAARRPEYWQVSTKANNALTSGEEIWRHVALRILGNVVTEHSLLFKTQKS